MGAVRVTLTRVGEHKVVEFLRDQLVALPDDADGHKMCRYRDPAETDGRIAERCGVVGVTAANVMSLRREFYGLLKPAQNPSGSNSPGLSNRAKMAMRIKALEQAHNRLCELLGEPGLRVNGDDQ